jgi:hypothetical protein
MANTNEEWPKLRPYQRKITILHLALDLIYTLDFITDEEKAHIISMSPKNKGNDKPIIARMAFHRAQGLAKEIESKILSGVEKLMDGDKTHDQVCDAFVQNLFVSGVHRNMCNFYASCTHAFGVCAFNLGGGNKQVRPAPSSLDFPPSPHLSHLSCVLSWNGYGFQHLRSQSTTCCGTTNG